MRKILDIIKKRYLKPLFRIPEKYRQVKNRYLYTKYFKQCKIREKTVFYQAYRNRIMAGNPYAIFLELINRPEYSDFTHVWIYGREESLQDDGFRRFADQNNVVYVKAGTKEYFKALASCQYLINNAALPDYWSKKEGQIYINTWHGTPLKTLGRHAKDRRLSSITNAQRNFFLCDYLVMPNRYTIDRLMESYDIRNLFPGKMVDAGYPRVDLVQNTDKGRIRSLLEEKLGTSLEGKKLVLYAPTFRSVEGNSVDTSDVLGGYMTEIMKALPENYELVFKVHNLLAVYFRNNREMQSRLIFDEIETNELLSVVDVLITDYSSVFFEFLCRKKPILFFVYDRMEYEGGRGLYRPLEELPGVLCETVEELRENFLRIEEGIYSCEDRHERYLEEFAYHDDGGASRRVVDIVFEGKKDPTYVFEEPGKQEKVLVLADKIEKTEEKLACMMALKKQNFETSTVMVHAQNAFSFAEDVESVSKEIKINGFDPMLMMTMAERVCLRLLKRVLGEKRFWERQYRKFFGPITFDRVIDVTGKNTRWKQILDGRCGNYEIFYPRGEKAIRKLREDSGHVMTVLFVGGFDSSNYVFINLIRELQKRGYRIQVVVADDQDHTNNKMFIEQDIPLINVKEYAYDNLTEVDFAILATFTPGVTWPLVTEIRRRRIFLISFAVLYSTVGLRFYPDLAFALGTNKFREFEAKGFHYSMVATGNPQYDDLIAVRRETNNLSQKSIKRILFIDQGGYPFGIDGKRTLGNVILAMAKHHPDKEFVVKPRFLPDEQDANIPHKPSEHLYDFIPDPPENLTLLRTPTILEDIMPEYDAMVTMWSTAHLDAALLGIPLMLIQGLPTEEVFDVRSKRVEDAYESLSRSGCVVDYREVLEGKLEFHYVNEDYLRAEVGDFKTPSSPRIVELLEMLYDQLVVPGKRLGENVQSDMEGFIEKLPNLKKIGTWGKVQRNHREFMSYLNRKVHDLEFENRCMGEPFDLSPIRKYWDLYPHEHTIKFQKMLVNYWLYKDISKLRNDYYKSSSMNTETDSIRLDYYFEWLFVRGKDTKIRNFSNPHVLPVTRDYYLSMVELRHQNVKEAAKLYASYYHKSHEMPVKSIRNARKLSCKHFPANVGVCVSFFEELKRMNEYELLKEISQILRQSRTLQEHYRACNEVINQMEKTA